MKLWIQKEKHVLNLLGENVLFVKQERLKWLLFKKHLPTIRLKIVK